MLMMLQMKVKNISDSMVISNSETASASKKMTTRMKLVKTNKRYCCSILVLLWLLLHASNKLTATNITAAKGKKKEQKNKQQNKKKQARNKQTEK